MISSSTYERQKAEAPPSPCSNNENCKPDNGGMHLCSSENVVHTLAQPLPTQLIDNSVKSTKNGRFRFSGRNKNNKSQTPQDSKKGRIDCPSTTRQVPPKHHSVDISNTTIDVNEAESVIPPAKSTSGNKKRHFGLRLRRSFDRFNSLHMSHKTKQFHHSRNVDGLDLNISREESDVVPDDKERWKYDPNLSLNKHKKSVSFTSLSIREFDLCLGDNPSCSDGLPLSLSWNCLRSETIDLESYERCRGPRRSMAELKMEPEFRRELVYACLPPESSMRKTEREQYRSRNRDSTATMRRKQSDKLKAGFFCPLPTKTDQTSSSVPI